MFDIIAYPLGQILGFIYNNLAFQNYGIAIVVFTVIVKTLMLPLSIKQYKTTSKMEEFQPQILEIQKRYKEDQEKQSVELMKLYQENKINPAGGCFPLMIQMPVLFSLYYVISHPLKYMSGKSNEVILTLYDMIPQEAGKLSNMKDLSIITYFGNYPEKLAETASMLKAEDLLNMNFMGINLGAVPTLKIAHYLNFRTGINSWLLLIIPFLAAFTSYIAAKYSVKEAKGMAASTVQDTTMQKNMMILSPLMSGVIAFTVPAGVGLYWIVGNVYQIIQQLFINRFLSHEKKGKSQKDFCQ